ncbi:putative WRKY transcription factor 19 [Phytophthora citrophthora]|uniref:WRKY transcription factor 19 n=1 Tax=Phytophthora citrophthora TaxID=4793 RepID=A0AAD9LSM1_9STRA|nr:putative WRKY transcription factor 19 [Phytophthora citrophthora]
MNIYQHNLLDDRPFPIFDAWSDMILGINELSDLLDFIIPDLSSPGFVPIPLLHQPTFGFEIRSPSASELVISHNMHNLSYNALPLFDLTPSIDPIPFTSQNVKHEVVPLPVDVLAEVFELSLPEKQRKRHPFKIKDKAKCEVDGCNTFKQSHGRCIRHGGGKRCQVEGCTRGAQTKGRCKRHGGGARCQVVGCTASSQGGGLCRTHGGGKICIAPGCKKGAQREGKCAKHTVRSCLVDGCLRSSRCRGFCTRHKMQAKA